MRLADETKITIGSKKFTLRPTLRAAVRLHKDYDGLQNLYTALGSGSVTASLDLISAACADPRLVVLLAYEVDKNALESSVWSIRDQLQAFVLKLSGHDGDGEPASTGKPIPYDEYFTTLYRIATGWLGWNRTSLGTPHRQRSSKPRKAALSFCGRSSAATISRTARA